MKKIKIKGKDYVMAHERVKEFHNLYKNGSIKTEIIEMTDRFITRTTVTPDVANSERCFTGLAYEDIASNGVNSTSALENCETSSCSRALGMLNIGIDTSIASYEEVSNAIKQQEKKESKQPSVNKDEEHPLADTIKKTMETKTIDDSGDDVISFGKHKGTKWSDVDESYLKWVAKNLDRHKDTAQKYLDARQGKIVEEFEDEVPF